jgi:ubiquinone/menaquinone biosynthesis C-methylase UbiE
MNIKQKIEVYDKIAGTWGSSNARYWNYFGNRLVELTGIVEGADVLDIGSGRGASLFPAVEKVGQYGSVTGIEISKEMVEQTSIDIKARRLDNVRILHMDVRNMSFEDASFDFAISGFTLGSFVLDELMRVLKNSAKAGFSSWGKIDGSLLDLYRKYLPDEFSSQGDSEESIEFVTNMLSDAGFSDIITVTEKKAFVYKSEDEWWEQLWDSTMNFLFLKKVENKAEGNIDKFKDEAFMKLQDYKQDNGFRLAMNVIFSFGVKKRKEKKKGAR